jgi:hypothetical protein
MVEEARDIALPRRVDDFVVVERHEIHVRVAG